jgi:cytochrome c-type biogenesis protein CcmH
LKVLATLFAAFLIAMALVPISSVRASAQPEESTYVAPLANPVLEARARALQRELRCVVCQAQSVDESNSMWAIDLRKLIRQQIQAGQTNDDIKNFLVARYGSFVLMQPPMRQDTFFLWFGPGLLVLIGAAVIGVTVMRSRRRLGSEPGAELDASS